MKQTVNLNKFIDAFRQSGRKDQFSYEGLTALFEHLEELEKDQGEEYELDIIELCCEYTEYESFEEFAKDYSDYESLDELERDQCIIKIDDERFIIQNF